jgi:hypothetical protein
MNTLYNSWLVFRTEHLNDFQGMVTATESYCTAKLAHERGYKDALHAAAKVAREWNWRISADEICQDCSNVASEEIAAAIERLKE